MKKNLSQEKENQKGKGNNILLRSYNYLIFNLLNRKRSYLSISLLLLISGGICFTNACQPTEDSGPYFYPSASKTATMTPTVTPDPTSPIDLSLEYINNSFQDLVGYKLSVLSDTKVQVSSNIDPTWKTPDIGYENGIPIAFVYKQIGNKHLYTITRSFEKYWFSGDDYFKTHNSSTISFRKEGGTEVYSQNINFPQPAKIRVNIIKKTDNSGFSIDIYNAGPGVQIKSTGLITYDWTDFSASSWTIGSDNSFLPQYVIYHLGRNFSEYGDAAKGKSFTATVKNVYTKEETSYTINIP